MKLEQMDFDYKIKQKLRERMEADDVKTRDMILYLMYRKLEDMEEELDDIRNKCIGEF